MPVTESSILVADDPQGTRKIDNARVTTGEGNVERQVTVTADPEDPNARQKITNARPSVSAYAGVVRSVPPGFDSGLLTLPASPDVVTASSMDVLTIFLSNITDQVQHVTLTDGPGLLYLDQYPVPPRDCRLLAFGGIRFNGGVKWFAGAANAVQGQVKGDA